MKQERLEVMESEMKKKSDINIENKIKEETMT